MSQKMIIERIGREEEYTHRFCWKLFYEICRDVNYLRQTRRGGQ